MGLLLREKKNRIKKGGKVIKIRLRLILGSIWFDLNIKQD
jgi:hypothetical protein